MDEPSYIGRLVPSCVSEVVYQQQATNGVGDRSLVTPLSIREILPVVVLMAVLPGEGSFCKNYKVGCFGYLMALALCSSCHVWFRY